MPSLLITFKRFQITSGFQDFKLMSFLQEMLEIQRYDSVGNSPNICDLCKVNV